VSKESTYYDEAERLYTFGRTLQEIAGLLPVSIASLSRWKTKGDWETKRKAALASNRTVAESLREVLRGKVEGILAKGDISASQTDEIAKILAAIDRMERGSYNFLAAAVEVMRRFTEWLRKETGPEERELVGKWIQAWFKAIE